MEKIIEANLGYSQIEADEVDTWQAAVPEAIRAVIMKSVPRKPLHAPAGHYVIHGEVHCGMNVWASYDENCKDGKLVEGISLGHPEKVSDHLIETQKGNFVLRMNPSLDWYEEKIFIGIAEEFYPVANGEDDE